MNPPLCVGRRVDLASAEFRADHQTGTRFVMDNDRRPRRK